MSGPIFVCGASRSGTALVRSVLNNAPGVLLAGETHYFDDLRVKLGSGTRALDEGERQRCSDYFLSLAHRPYGHSGEADHSKLERAQLDQLAGQLGDTGDAYFEAFCRLAAEGKPVERWGEKTPRHIYRLREILERYPEAQAVCMVRDPRAVVASYRDWQNQGGFDLEQDPGHVAALEKDEQRVRKSYHPLIISLLWKGTVGSAREAQRTFGSKRVWIQQYEQVVLEPAKTIQAMVEWLGIAYTPELLDVPMHNSSFSKFDSAGGISKAPLERWKKKLSEREIAVVQSACGELLTAVGYERLDVHAGAMGTAMAWASLPWASLRALLANRERMGNIPSYLLRRTASLFASRK